MFSNIGTKIKTLAQILCWVGILGTAIAGLILLATDTSANGIALLLIGPPAFWIGSFFLYGFGQLIENTDKLIAIQSNATGTAAPLSQADKLNKLKILKEMQQYRLINDHDIQHAKEEWES